MTEIQWEELPARLRGPESVPFDQRHADFLDALRSNPGRWARFHVNANPPSATAYAARCRKQLTPLGFEVAMRTVDGEGVTFVRYVGGEA